MLDSVDRDVAAFLLTLKDKPVIIGHSLGGFLAIRLAEEHSDLIRGPSPSTGCPCLRGWRRLTPQARATAAAAVGARVANASPADFAAAQAYQISYMTKPAKRADRVELLSGSERCGDGNVHARVDGAPTFGPAYRKSPFRCWKLGPFDATIDSENPYNPMATLRE